MGLNDETLRLNGETLGLNDETLGLNDETLGLSDETSGLSGETLELNGETSGLSGETLGLNDESSGLSDETLELNGETLGFRHLIYEGIANRCALRLVCSLLYGGPDDQSLIDTSERGSVTAQVSPMKSVELRRALRRWSVPVFLLSAVFLFVWSLRGGSSRVREVSERTNELLKRTIVSTAESRPADLDGVIARLNEYVEASEARGKIRFARWSEPDLPAGYAQRSGGWRPQIRAASFPIPQPPPAIPGLEAPSGDDLLASQILMLKFADQVPSQVDLQKLIEHVCYLFDCDLGQRGDTVYFVCGAKRLLERTYSVDAWQIAHMRPYGDLSGWCKANGVRLGYDGSYVRLIGNEKVEVRVTEEDLVAIEGMLNIHDIALLDRVVEQWYRLRHSLGIP